MIFRGRQRSQADADGGPPRRGLGREDLGRLARLLAYTRPYRGWLTAGIAAVAVAGGLGLLFPLIIRDLLNTAFAPGAAGGAAGLALDRTALLLFALMLVQAAFNYLRTYGLGRVGEAVVADLRKELFAHVLSLDIDFFARRKTGEITSRLTSDIATVQAAVSQALAQLVNQGITLVGGIVVLFVLEARLTLVMMAVIPPVVLAAAFFGRRLRRLSTGFQDRLAAANANAEEAIAGVRVVKSFTAERLESRRYGGAIDESFRLALRRVKLRALFTPAVILAVFAGLGVVLWYGGRLALAGDLQGGDLVAFLLITMFVAGSLGSFTGLYAQLQEAIGASKRIFELLDERPTMSSPVGAGAGVPMGRVEGLVSFEGVSFRYGGRGDDYVLAGIDLTARAGEVVAIVGPSGAGKSTLVGLVPRFHDPTEGSVKVDGVDLRRLDLEELRAHVGIVPQETTLFSGSVAENIRYGRPDASDAEVVEAATAANAHDFISAFPDGYQTTVGERGLQLSGGQRQRVAIARALLKNPRILILDEATSSLDSESEAAVQAALERLMLGRTTFVIAHRLSTVLGADQIVVLADGRIVERGTHAELAERGQLYSELFQRQLRAGLTTRR